MAGMFRQAMAILSGGQKSAREELNGRKCGFRDARDNGWFRRDTGELAPDFPITPADTVIDVGCGEGGASVFAARMGAEVIATDANPEMIEVVRRKLEKLEPRSFRTVVSDTNPLPLDDAIATRVMALEVLEHVQDPQQFMAELVRVGQPEALYLIAVPDPTSESIQRRIAAPSYWEKPNHLRIFPRDQLDTLVEQAGLRIQRRMYRSFFWAMWWILFWASDQKPGEPEGPILNHWTQTWHALMDTPKGNHIRQALDEFMPKSQVIVARKAA